jgi:hypothetical protein
MQQAGDQSFMCDQMLLPAADLERYTHHDESEARHGTRLHFS